MLSVTTLLLRNLLSGEKEKKVIRKEKQGRKLPSESGRDCSLPRILFLFLSFVRWNAVNFAFSFDLDSFCRVDQHLNLSIYLSWWGDPKVDENKCIDRSNRRNFFLQSKSKDLNINTIKNSTTLINTPAGRPCVSPPLPRIFLANGWWISVGKLFCSSR